MRMQLKTPKAIRDIILGIITFLVVGVVLIIMSHRYSKPLPMPYFLRLDQPTPQSVYISGFYPQEPWGRWTANNYSKIEFGATLPSEFTITITAHTFGANIGKRFTFKVGKEVGFLKFNSKHEVRQLRFERVQSANSLEIFTPEPGIPEVGDGKGTDNRKLGLAISEIRFTLE